MLYQVAIVGLISLASVACKDSNGSLHEAAASDATPSTKSAETNAAFSRLSNNDVTWDGDFAGLVPKISANAESVRREGRTRVPELRQMLLDDDRFVIAHVLLVEILNPPAIPRPPTSIRTSCYYWLPVKLKSKGAIINVADKPIVLKYWEKVGLSEDPHDRVQSNPNGL